MAREQILRENYEYTLSDTEFAEYKRLAIANARRPIIGFSCLAVAALIFTIIEYNLFSLGLCIVFMTFAAIFGITLRTTVKSFRGERIEGGMYRLRFYDDFLIFEIATGEGIETRTTTRLDKLTLISSKSDSVILIMTGIHIVPVRRELLSENSFIMQLIKDPGKKFFRSSPDTPEHFVETVSPTACACANDEIKDAEDTVGSDASAENWGAENVNTEEAQSTEDMTDEGSKSKTSDSASPYLFETLVEDAEQNRTVRRISFGSVVLAALAVITALIMDTMLRAPGSNAHYLTLILLAVPVMNIGIGVFAYRHHARGGKNFICAIVSALLISVIAFSPSVDDPILSNNAEALEFLNKTEALVSADFPDGEDYFFSADDESGDVYFSLFYEGDGIDAAKGAFEKCENAVKAMPSTHIGILPDFSRSNDQMYCLVYNFADKTFNSLPKKDGTYRMLYIEFYEYEDNTAAIYFTEYDIEYSTEFKK